MYDAVTTLSGEAFLKFPEATGKAWLPSADSLKEGTARCWRTENAFSWEIQGIRHKPDIRQQNWSDWASAGRLIDWGLIAPSAQ